MSVLDLIRPTALKAPKAPQTITGTVDSLIRQGLAERFIDDEGRAFLLRDRRIFIRASMILLQHSLTSSPNRKYISSAIWIRIVSEPA